MTHSNMLAWEIPWTEEPGRLHTVYGVAKSETLLSLYAHTYGGARDRAEGALHSSGGSSLALVMLPVFASVTPFQDHGDNPGCISLPGFLS